MNVIISIKVFEFFQYLSDEFNNFLSYKITNKKIFIILIN